MVREEYKKLKPILEAKKEEERRKKQEARRKEVELEAKASEKKSQAERKGDKGTRTVSTTASTTANSTFSTADSGDACQVSTHIAVDSRFRPCLLCKDPVDVRGSLRGFGDCSVIPRGSLGRRVIERIDCANWSDIVKGSMRNGIDSVCTSSVEYHGWESLGKEERIVRKSRHHVLVIKSLLGSRVRKLVVRK